MSGAASGRRERASRNTAAAVARNHTVTSAIDTRNESAITPPITHTPRTTRATTAGKTSQRRGDSVHSAVLMGVLSCRSRVALRLQPLYIHGVELWTDCRW